MESQSSGGQSRRTRVDVEAWSFGGPLLALKHGGMERRRRAAGVMTWRLRGMNAGGAPQEQRRYGALAARGTL